jgi:hypothetical protein
VPKPIPVNIRDYLNVDSSSPTGLIWIKTDHCKNKVVTSGTSAGFWDASSKPAYYKVVLNGKKYKAHRVIWFLCTGEDPAHNIVDHIDRNRKNNVISNLRLVNSKHSADNRNTWGSVCYRGVSWAASSNCYVSVIRENGKLKNLGLYEDPIDAALVWDAAAISSGNSYKNLNFPDADPELRSSACSRRLRQRGTFLNGLKLVGVSLDKSRNLYQAYVRIPCETGKSTMRALGRYQTAFEAACVRDAEVLRLGLDQKLNFPTDMK